MAFRGFKDTLGNHLENKLSIGNGKKSLQNQFGFGPS